MTFQEYITSRLSTPFKWGAHDCINFTVGWVELSTGKDYLSSYGEWETEDEARVAIEEAGGLEAAFNANFTPIQPTLAKDGDLTIINNTAYLFSGNKVVSAGKSGLIFNARGVATCAWSY